MDHLETKGRAPNTIRAAEYHAGHLVDVIDRQKRLDEITLADTTAYLETRLSQLAGVYGTKLTSKHTVSKELRFLLQAMRRCAKLGLYVQKIDPTHLLPDDLEDVYTPRNRWLSVEQYGLLHAELGRSAQHHSAEHDRRDYLAMYCHAGLRKSELFDVLPEHYDVLRRELFVDGTKTKDANRQVPLNDVAHEVMMRRMRGAPARTPLFPVWHTAPRDLTRACERVEIAMNAGWAVASNDKCRGMIEQLRKRGAMTRLELAAALKLSEREVWNELLLAQGEGLIVVQGPEEPASERLYAVDGDIFAEYEALFDLAEDGLPPPREFLRVTPNDLRRTFCSWLCNAGVPERVCAQLMGHASTQMVRAVYGQLDKKGMVAAVRLLPGNEGKTSPV